MDLNACLYGKLAMLTLWQNAKISISNVVVCNATVVGSFPVVILLENNLR